MSSLPNEGLVTVDAEMKTNFEADAFTLTVDFEGECDSKEECVEKYNAEYADVREALLALGVSSDNIRNGEFSIYAHRSHRRRLGRKPTSEVTGYWYEGGCVVKGKLEEGGVLQMWRALHRLKGDFSFDISYWLSDLSACERKLLQSAVFEAKTRAEALASAAEVELGPVSRITHKFNHASKAELGSMSYGAMSSPDGSKADREKPQFKPAEIEVHCNVTVAWRVA